MSGSTSADFNSRFAMAKQWRQPMQSLIEEVYSFCAPDRRNCFNSTDKSVPESDVFHSLGEELAGDLAGDLITYFTPAEARWFTSLVEFPADLEPEKVKVIEKMVTEREGILEDMFNASNYNDMSPQWGFEAAAHGTPAVWVQQSHISQPVHFEAVPPDELYITPGHLGYLDRFRETTVHASTLNALFVAEIAKDQVSLTDPALVQKMKKGGATCVVIWGFWLTWEDAGRPMWQMEITVDGKSVTQSGDKKFVEIGDMAGACPLIVGRFNPRPKHPWGRGCGLKMLPDMRVLDKVDETVLLGLEDAISNTFIYPSDGFIDMSEGYEIGKAYPSHRGFNRDQIYEFNKTHNLDVGFFTEESLDRKIRAGFYQDGPRQRGDTPPTAAQWFDEARRVQQRLGKPSAPLWTEFVYPMVQRVEYLGIESGRLEMAIVLDGETVSVQPISPLQKAQNRDQVMIARSNLELARENTNGETAQAVDLISTFENIIKASGDTLTVIAKPQEPANDPNAAGVAPPQPI